MCGQVCGLIGFPLEPPTEVLRACHKSSIHYVAFSTDNEDIVFTGSYNVSAIYHCKRNKKMAFLSFLKRKDCCNVTSIVISKDGLHCASGHSDGSVRRWNIAKGVSDKLRCVLKPLEKADPVCALLLFSDENRTIIVSGSVGGIIRIWDTETGEDLYGQMTGHRNCINGVALSPDGCRLASSSNDCTIGLWDMGNGERIKVLKGHKSDVWSAIFSPCGTKIISASYDTTIRIWDSVSGEQIGRLEGHTQWVYCAEFSPDRRFIVSGSGDRTIRIWDPETGETLAIYDAKSAVRSVAFSGNGRRIVSGCDNGDVHIWDASLLV